MEWKTEHAKVHEQLKGAATALSRAGFHCAVKAEEVSYRAAALALEPTEELGFATRDGQTVVAIGPTLWFSPTASGLVEIWIEPARIASSDGAGNRAPIDLVEPEGAREPAQLVIVEPNEVSDQITALVERFLGTLAEKGAHWALTARLPTKADEDSIAKRREREARR